MQRINALLENHTDLTVLSQKAAHLTACQKLWNAVAPEALRPHTQAGDVTHKRLTVYASNGAVASKVKLLLPSLLTQLQKRGLEVTSIRVQVQVQSGARAKPKKTRKLSTLASQELEKLAATLGDDSMLATSLKRLAAKAEN